MTPNRGISLVTCAALAFAMAPSALTAAASTPFLLRWTAPGDDGTIGRASVYDLRWSDLPLTAANFGEGTRVVGLNSPATAGTPESLLVQGVPDGVQVYLAIKTGDDAGNWSAISNVVKHGGQTTGLPTPVSTASFSLPWPNPARESVRWAYALPQASQAQVEVFDVTGRRVHTIASGTLEAGSGELSWDLRDDRGGQVGSGIYFVRARLGSLQSTNRLLVAR